jgi:hypothetical protein
MSAEALFAALASLARTMPIAGSAVPTTRAEIARAARCCG